MEEDAQDYKTIFNLEVYSIKHGNGRIVSCRAGGDDLQLEDMLTTNQMLSNSMNGLINQVNKKLLHQNTLKFTERFEKSGDDGTWQTNTNLTLAICIKSHKDIW